ncbi:MAG TPA: c-type cytochrome [Methylotenera sp.]|nr:c-type cytochrome [Methylotenera sp.]
MIIYADTAKTKSPNTPSQVTTEPIARHVHTRSLAASCAACHGTNGNSSGNAAKLAGMDSTYFVAQMQAFKSGERASTVMHRHVKGLNPQEISDLAEYFSAQVPSKQTALPSQKLSRSAHN